MNIYKIFSYVFFALFLLTTSFLIGLFLGVARTYANVVLAKSYECSYSNTVLAHLLADLKKEKCVKVLLTPDLRHVRYVVGSEVVDVSCRKLCDNLTYVEFLFCRENDRLTIKSVRVIK